MDKVDLSISDGRNPRVLMCLDSTVQVVILQDHDLCGHTLILPIYCIYIHKQKYIDHM
jgi:hypothetical protein